MKLRKQTPRPRNPIRTRLQFRRLFEELREQPPLPDVERARQRLRRLQRRLNA